MQQQQELQCHITYYIVLVSWNCKHVTQAQ